MSRDKEYLELLENYINLSDKDRVDVFGHLLVTRMLQYKSIDEILEDIKRNLGV